MNIYLGLLGNGPTVPSLTKMLAKKFLQWVIMNRVRSEQRRSVCWLKLFKITGFITQASNKHIIFLNKTYILRTNKISF